MSNRVLPYDFKMKYRNKAVEAGTREQIASGFVNPVKKKLTKKEEQKERERQAKMQEMHELKVEQNEKKKETFKSLHMQHGHATKK
jgi:hypothetical protein